MVLLYRQPCPHVVLASNGAQRTSDVQVTAFTPSSVSSMDDVVGYDFVVSLGSVGSHTHDFFLANPWPRKWNTAR